MSQPASFDMPQRDESGRLLCQCWMCKRTGLAEAEFTGYWDGLCSDCRKEHPEEAQEEARFCVGLLQAVADNDRAWRSLGDGI